MSFQDPIRSPDQHPQYDAMPPPKAKGDAENAPLVKTTPNAWVKGRIPTEQRTSAQIGSIHEANDPSAKEKAPSLIGRVFSAIGSFFSDIGNAISRIFNFKSKEASPEEAKDDLSYVIDTSDVERYANELGKIGEASAAGEKREQAKALVNKLNQEATGYKGMIKTMSKTATVSDFGKYFAEDKKAFDTALKNFNTHVDENTSDEDLNKFLQGVIDASNRLKQTYEMEMRREKL